MRLHMVRAFAALWLAALWLAGGTAAAAPPNIVFILADDMDYAALQWMPQTRALVGDGGATFTRSYAEVALCCPARATLLTGLYAHTHRVLTVDNANGGFRQFRKRGHEKQTLAVWLRNAGYETALVGKYLNGFPDDQPETYVPPGWSWWVAAVQRGETPYRQFDYKLNENGKLVFYGKAATAYGTDVYARKAVEFIQAQAKAGKPFFLFLSLFSPHAPATAAPRHKAMFADAVVPRTPSFAEADISDKPSFLRNSVLDAAAVAALDADYGQRLRSLQAVDEAVRKVHDALKAAGRLDDTYIVFASDNGYHDGQHMQPAGKQLPYEEDIRQPLLIRGPGIPAGRIVDQLVGNADLAPSIAALAGVPLPVPVDGRSFVPLLAAPLPTVPPPAVPPPAVPPPTDPSAVPWRQALPLARWRIPNATSDPWPEFTGVRTAAYTWIEWANGERELYDDNADPYQLSNLAADPALEATRMQLARLNADLKACRGPVCKAVEDRAPVQLAR